MKKLLSLSLVLLLSSSLVSQNMLSVGAGVNTMSFNTNQLNGFVTSFNEFYSSQLSKPMDKFGLAYGYSIGVGGVFDNYPKVIGATITKESLYQSSFASFNDNTGVELLQHLAKTTLYTDYGWYLMDNMTLSGTIAASLWRNDIRHYTVYPDNTKSLGRDATYNGIYSSVKVSFDFGFNLAYWIKPVKLELRALKDFTVASTGLIDASIGKTLEGNYLPINYGESTSNQSNRINGVFPGFYFGLMVSYFISNEE